MTIASTYKYKNYLHLHFNFFYRTSLFIISSFIYAKLLVVVCIAYVISDVITHNLPLYYYEGFFTYLYGMSILFLLYVFCFLLQGMFIYIAYSSNIIYHPIWYCGLKTAYS